MTDLKLDGAALASAREAAGLSQAQFADLCGITAAYMSQLENGLRQPSPAMAQNLTQKLGEAWRAHLRRCEAAMTAELPEIMRPAEAAS